MVTPTPFVIDMAFTANIDLFTWDGIGIVIAFFLLLLIYWGIRFVVSIVTG